MTTRWRRLPKKGGQQVFLLAPWWPTWRLVRGSDSVVNCSIGLTTAPVPYLSVDTAMSNLVSKGIVVVAAAGNSAVDIAGPDGVFGINPTNGVSDDIIPAALPEVMAVSSINVATERVSGFSNYSYAPRATNLVNSPGGAIDVAAPGDDSSSNPRGIYGAAIGGYTYMYGTSVSAPHVAGLVALYIAANGRATNAEGVYRIRQAIVDNSLPHTLTWFACFMLLYGIPNPLRPLVRIPRQPWCPLCLLGVLRQAGLVSFVGAQA